MRLILGVLLMAVLAYPASNVQAAAPTLYDMAAQGIPDLDALARPITGQRWFAQGASNYCVGYAALNQLRRNGITLNPDDINREHAVGAGRQVDGGCRCHTF